MLKDSVSDRQSVLKRAQEAFASYLDLLEKYNLLSRKDKLLLDRFLDSPDEFALMSSNDATARRDTKIARLKQEKELRFKLEARMPYCSTACI